VSAPISLEGAVEEAFETEIPVKFDQFLRHLKRLHAFVPEVVLSGPFRAAAESVEHDVVVMTAGLPDTEPLPGEVGIGSLEGLLGELACLKGDGVQVIVKNGQLVCAERGRRIRFRTSEPDLIVSKLEPRLLQHLIDLFAPATWQPFRPDVAKGVVQAITGLGAANANVAFRVGPEGMTIIVYLYALDANCAEFEVGEVTAETAFTLLVKADRIRAIFSQIGDSLPVITFVESEQVVGLRLQAEDNSVEMTYLISGLEQTAHGPRARVLPTPKLTLEPPSPDTNVAP